MSLAKNNCNSAKARPLFHSISRRSGERGLALMLVVFILALATVLVVNLAYSTYLGSRLTTNAQQSVQAEYLLKSAANVGRILLHEDNLLGKTPGDSIHNLSSQFKDGLPIPAEFLGLKQPNIQVSLEMAPEDAKLQLSQLYGVSVNTSLRDTFSRLFQSLGFDNDGEVDQTGRFPDRHFNSEEMVANLIDYMDPDLDSYSAPNFKQGIESDLPDGVFENKRVDRLEDLYRIPGFTPRRMAALTPYITKEGSGQVNLLFCSEVVFKSLSPNITSAHWDKLLELREQDAFQANNKSTVLSDAFGSTIAAEIDNLVGTSSTRFYILGKVNYGTAVFFMRSIVDKGSSTQIPRIYSFELF